MNERILYRNCPLCDGPSLVDSSVGNCSGHPVYHRSLSPFMKWKECADCSHVFTEGYFTEEACKLIFGKTNENQRVGADNVAMIASFGVEAYCQDLAALSLDSPCAVISMADVLEHVPFPKDTLRAAHRLLDEDGVLFISMPNMESTVWTALDEKQANPYWGEIEHYHNFSRSRLYALLREFDFEPVRYGISERYRVCMEVIAKRVG